MEMLLRTGLVGLVAAKVPTKEIAPGVHMPMVGLGTWDYNSSVAEGAVYMALEHGVRHINIARGFGLTDNQEGIAAALKRSSVARDEIFISTKVPGGLGFQGTLMAHDNGNLRPLDMEYVDLLVADFPCIYNSGTLAHCSKHERQETWRALEYLVNTGKARAIGVAHYCQQHIEDVLENATLPIAVNQQEWHVGMGPDPNGMQSFCKDRGITYTAFSPLCGKCDGHDTELITGELVTNIGKAHGKTGAQVALKWLVQNGSPIFPKTSNPSHVMDDIDLFSWDLTDTEMDQLSAATSPPSEGTLVDGTVKFDCDISVAV